MDAAPGATGVAAAGAFVWPKAGAAAVSITNESKSLRTFMPTSRSLPVAVPGISDVERAQSSKPIYKYAPWHVGWATLRAASIPSAHVLAVELAVLAREICHIRLDAHGLAGGAPHHLVGRELAAVAIEILHQPVPQPVEAAGADLPRNVRIGAQRRRMELRAQHIADRVALEAAADQAAVPVHVLQAAVAVVGRADAEIGQVARPPGVGQVLHGEPAFEQLELEPSGAQGWFINTRRKKFSDPRLREALCDAFDFEWTNKAIMYGAYLRTISVFQNSNMMAQGAPGADELALLEPFRGRVPDEVFGAPYTPPVSDGSGQDRALLRKATKLLQDAGCAIKDGVRVSPDGTPISIEFLIDEPTFEPHHMPFIKNLGTLGIAASLRIVDPVQYRARRDAFDFDITVDRFNFSATPGDGLRSYFSSTAATLTGSSNLAGMSDPAIDALIDAVIAAPTRPALVTACRALDRVIRAGRYWIPHWYKPSHWVAYWDVFGHLPAGPRYARGIPETWWYHADKAGKIERNG